MTSEETISHSTDPRRLPKFWEWKGLSEPERVEQYTLQTLNLMLLASPGLILLAAIAQAGDSSLWLPVSVVFIAVLTVLAQRVLRQGVQLYPARSPVPWRLVAATAGWGVGITLVAAAIPSVREGLVYAVGTATYCTVAISLSAIRNKTVTVVMAACTVICTLAASQQAWTSLPFSLFATGFLFFTVRSSLWLVGVVRELEAARDSQSQLAVAEERLRFARDVHDVMGRQLSAIAIQSELGAALAERGDPSASQTMLGVRELANEALREARELARGYRAPDLDHEVQGAVALLRSAGISCHTNLTDVPPADAEAAAWVIRESVTNILRHSSASSVEISYRNRQLMVRNDGASAAEGEGNGIIGLRERLAARGGTLTVRRQGEEFELEAVLS